MKLVFLEQHCLYQLETCTPLISKPLLEASEPKRHPVQNAAQWRCSHTLFEPENHIRIRVHFLKKTFKVFTEIKSVWIKYKLETKSLLPVTKELWTRLNSKRFYYLLSWFQHCMQMMNAILYLILHILSADMWGQDVLVRVAKRFKKRPWRNLY